MCWASGTRDEPEAREKTLLRSFYSYGLLDESKEKADQ